MTTTRDLLADLENHEHGLIRTVAGGVDHTIEDLQIMEDLRPTDTVPRGVLLFLTKPASVQAEGYELDVALRRLDHPAGLILQRECQRPSPTGLRLAQRLGIPIVVLQMPIDLGGVFARAVRLLDEETGILLERAGRLLDVIDEADRSDGKIIEQALTHDTFGFSVGPREPGHLGTPIVVAEPEGDWIQRASTTRSEDLVGKLVSWRVTGAVTRQRIETDRADQLALLSAGALLDQVLRETNEPELRRLIRQARGLGLAIDGWHEAVRFEHDNLLSISGNNAILAYDRNANLARLAVQTATRSGGTWTMVLRPSGSLLIRTRGRPRNPRDTREMVRQMTKVIATLHAHSPKLHIYCGIGSSHEGATGLSATEAEAESAIQSARLRKALNEPALFDAPGIRRLLIEWYSSMTVRESVEELLAPLGEIENPTQRSDYLNTLRVYLDMNRSATKVAEKLSVHRNTVVYRIKRMVELLGVDLDDPHQALALHLACHAESPVER